MDAKLGDPALSECNRQVFQRFMTAASVTGHGFWLHQRLIAGALLREQLINRCGNHPFGKIHCCFYPINTFSRWLIREPFIKCLRRGFGQLA